METSYVCRKINWSEINNDYVAHVHLNNFDKTGFYIGRIHVEQFVCVYKRDGETITNLLMKPDVYNSQ